MPEKPLFAGRIVGRGLESRSDKKVLKAFERLQSKQLKQKQVDALHGKIFDKLSHPNRKIKLEAIALVGKLAQNDRLNSKHLSEHVLRDLNKNIKGREYQTKYLSTRLVYTLSLRDILKKEHLNQEIIDQIHSMAKDPKDTTQGLALSSLSVKIINLWSKKNLIEMGSLAEGKSEWVIKK